jgi:hypothetical protein
MAQVTKQTRLKSYYKGHGKKVMADFKTRYGNKKGARLFYATINREMTSGTPKQKAMQPRTRPGTKR